MSPSGPPQPAGPALRAMAEGDCGSLSGRTGTMPSARGALAVPGGPPLSAPTIPCATRRAHRDPQAMRSEGLSMMGGATHRRDRRKGERRRHRTGSQPPQYRTWTRQRPKAPRPPASGTSRPSRMERIPTASCLPMPPREGGCHDARFVCRKPSPRKSMSTRFSPSPAPDLDCVFQATLEAHALFLQVL
jgi:hypothetical protein